MADYDLIIRAGNVVRQAGIKQCDIAITNEKIVNIDSVAAGSNRQEIDATGLHIFPSLIDTHVHFNEPGRANWEGMATGSAALAAGGGTVFVDMPLNSDPPLLTARDFRAKKRAAELNSITDYAFWGGLTPDNLEHLEDLAELGVIGFKAFMSNSGIAEFKAVDDLTLYRGMEKAATLNLPVAVHAESDSLTTALTQEIRGRGGTSIRDYLNSRPILAELEAINRALLLAKETGCDLHIVHVSSARGVQLINEAKKQGVRVTCETCPHYLHFTEEDAQQLGAVAKCAPPLRSNRERQRLWQSLIRGEIDMVASDHSPSSPDLKQSEDFFEVWGGIAGLQSSLNVLLHQRETQGLALVQLSNLIARRPAERFYLTDKGRLEQNFDADLTLVDLDSSHRLEPEQLFTRHKLSPYIGITFQGQVKQTILRGHTIFQNGVVSAPPESKFLRPRHI